MSDRPLFTLRLAHARLRVMLRALQKMLGDERRAFKPRDLARMRALLFRIRLEILPGAFVPGGGAPAIEASGVSHEAADHLQDLEHALTAFEVLGEELRVPMRVQALLFVEWQLARMDRLERAARAATGAVRGVRGVRHAPVAPAGAGSRPRGNLRQAAPIARADRLALSA